MHRPFYICAEHAFIFILIKNRIFFSDQPGPALTSRINNMCFVYITYISVDVYEKCQRPHEKFDLSPISAVFGMNKRIINPY